MGKNDARGNCRMSASRESESVLGWDVAVSFVFQLFSGRNGSLGAEEGGEEGGGGWRWGVGAA